MMEDIFFCSQTCMNTSFNSQFLDKVYFFVCFLFNRNVLNTIQVAFPVLIGKELVMLQKETFMRL